MYTYAGNIHIHSTHSDGTGSISEIAAAAAAAKLSYVVITDHETLRGLPEEGIHHGVVVLVGVEFNVNSCHYLALGLKEMLSSSEERPQETIDAVRLQGCPGFIAHPFETGSPYLDGGIAFPWTRWPVFGFTGMEIWNYSSHWRGRAASIPRIIYWFLFNRKGAMDGPPPECLRLWDCYTGSGHRVVGIGASDAHAARRRIVGIPVEVFPYEFLFRTINTYIVLREPLSDTFSRAREQIYTALAGGCCYLSFDQLHPGRDFSFTVSRSKEKDDTALMGEEIDYRKGLVLNVVSPARRSMIRLFRDGCQVHQSRNSALSYAVDSPGTYRAEVHHVTRFGRARPWIYGNPIYVRAS